MFPPTSFLHVHSFIFDYSIKPTPLTNWSVAVLAVIAPVLYSSLGLMHKRCNWTLCPLTISSPTSSPCEVPAFSVSMCLTLLPSAYECYLVFIILFYSFHMSSKVIPVILNCRFPFHKEKRTPFTGQAHLGCFHVLSVDCYAAVSGSAPGYWDLGFSSSGHVPRTGASAHAVAVSMVRSHRLLL